MTDDAWVPAAVRYKEIAALASNAASRLHRHEQEKAAKLLDEMPKANERIAAAQAQRDEVTDYVRQRWRAAMGTLWAERWMQVSAFPEPDRSVPPERLEGSKKAVQAAYFDLDDAVHRSASWLPAPGRSRRVPPRDGRQEQP